VRSEERIDMKDFRELIVWQKAMDLFEQVVNDVEGFPNKRAARVIEDQVLRSTGSISANIAEGYGRKKGKEFEHYLYISRGSTNETIDWYEKLKRLRYVSGEIFLQRESLCLELRAMLSKMIDSLEKKK
jgi:four helix bundle protein